MRIEQYKNLWKPALFACMLLMLNVGLSDAAFTQVKNAGVIVPLKVGDQLADVPVKPTSVLNFPGKVTRLSDITANKSVILDFFATWCSPCVAELPRLDSLQRAFGGQLQIVLITYEDRAKVAGFFKSNRTAAGIGLPVITGDTMLRATFPHKTVPHEVWLHGNKVKAITGPEHITATNITQLIKNRLPAQPLKYEDVTFDSRKPIFEKGNGGELRNMVYRSTLTYYLDGLTGGLGYSVDSNNLVSRIFAINTDIFNLCKHALGKTADHFPANRVQILSANPAKIKFNGQDYEHWKLNNTYTYELEGPPSSPAVLQQLMMDDLRRYLKIIPSVEKKEAEVYLLEADPQKSNALWTSGASPDENLYVKDNLPKYLTNQPITVLVDKLNELSPLPVINLTQLTRNIDILLPANLYDFPTLKKHLSAYGLNLILAKRKIEVLVVKETTSLPQNEALSF